MQKRVTARIPEKMANTLYQMHEVDGISMSHVIREGVTMYLESKKNK